MKSSVLNDFLDEKPKLRVGFLLDSFNLPAWSYTMINKIARSNYVQIELVVFGQRPNFGSGRQLRRFGRFLYALYTRFEDRLVRITPDAFELINARPLLDKIPVLNVTVLANNGNHTLKKEDVEKIRAKDLDVLIDLCSGCLNGDVVRSAKFGVWAYSHSDMAPKNDGLAGFWELNESSSVLYSTLYMMFGDSCIRTQLFKSSSHVYRTSLKRTRNVHFWKSSLFVPRKLEELYREGPEVFLHKTMHPGLNFESSAVQDRSYPTALDILKFMVRKWPLFVVRIAKDYFFDGQWILMLGKSMEISRFIQMNPPKGMYWADPFVVSRSDEYYIFVEEFDYDREKGHLSVIVLNKEGRYRGPEKILDRPYHLSYPFVFEVEECYYLIPESAENRTIDLYECKEFPKRWELKMTLMENILAYDSTLFRHNGKWWLFTTIVQVEGGPDADELFLFYSDDLFSSNWVFHPMNPVISDVSKGRCAGPVLRQDGKLFRLSQDCSQRYGYSFSLNEILVLNESEYQEQTILSVLPEWDRSIEATHTMSKAGELTVIDALLRRRRFFGRVLSKTYCETYNIPEILEQ